MPIVSYTGLPGHGKSYTAVEHVVLPALKQGRHVVTNLAVHAQEIQKRRFPGVLDELPTEVILAEPARILDYALPGCVLVIDEAWKFFPAGVKTTSVPKEYLKLFAEHRHMVNDAGDSMQIVLVTQDLSQVAAWVRALVEQTFQTTKLANLGMSKHYRIDVYNRGLQGSQMTKAKRQREIPGHFSPKIFKYYNSHTMSAAEAGGANERTMDRRFIVWRSPVWWLGVPAVLVMGAWGVHGVLDYFGGGAAEASAKGAPAPLRTPAARLPRARASITAVAAPAVERTAPAYRISGVVRSEDGRRGFVVIRVDEKTLVSLPWENCYAPGDGLTRCVFNGWTVTEIGAEPFSAQ